MYLPSSHKFDLLLNAQIKSFQSEIASVFDLDQEVSYDSAVNPLFKKEFFSFKVALKKLERVNDLHGKYTKWTEEFTHDEQFDFVFETKDTHSGM